MKICFATEVTYPNYVNRIKKSSLKCFLDKKLDKLDVYYYISTNLPNNFEEYSSNDKIRVFDIDKLRDGNNESKELELFPEDPTGLYPARYPWNCRRFIVEKAAKDGFDYIIYIDADTVFREDLSTEEFYNQIVANYEPNTVKTNSTIFRYKTKSPGDVFNFHDLYINHFNLNFEEDQYDTIDGPCQVFMGKSNEDILRFTFNWNKFAIFGYKKEFGYGYGNNKHGNLSFVIPISNFKLKWGGYPFFPNHNSEDRYTYEKKINQQVEVKQVENEITFSVESPVEITVESKIHSSESIGEFFKRYFCDKFQSGYYKTYDLFFPKLRQDELNILEIGVGSISQTPPENMGHTPGGMFGWKQKNPEYNPGSSLRAFRDYFEKSKIYGVDIQNDCKISEDRIETYIFNSTDKSSCDSNLTDNYFNIIIDDGDHDPEVRLKTLNNFFSKLSENGYYIIEGVINGNELVNYLEKNNFNFKYYNNNLIIINKNNNEVIIPIIETEDIKNNFKNIEVTPTSIEIEYVEFINSEDEFKINGLKFADKGFFVNLRSSTDRLKLVKEQISKYRIEGLNRFDALTDEWRHFSCTKSHLKVFENSLGEGHEIIFMAEDDFMIEDLCYFPNGEPQNVLDVLSRVHDDLKNVEWDVLLFGCNPKAPLIPITNNLAVVNRSTGAWAYLIKKNAYKYLLENSNYKRDLIAIDDYLPILNDRGFTTITTIPLTINHGVGLVSTLQPSGPVNYDGWIKGSYHKFLYDIYKENDFIKKKIENELTIVIAGHFVDNFIFYLNYLFHSLPDELKKCKILINYDESGPGDIGMKKFTLEAFFKDIRHSMNTTILYSNGGLISSIDNVLDRIKTPYFLFLEHDWVFLKKDAIDFQSILNSFNNNDFVHAVWLSKDDNIFRGFEITDDFDGSTTPFELESRVSECNLVTTCRWSNNPAVFRLSKFKEWFTNIIKNEHVGKVNQGSHNVEETMIPYYREQIKKIGWYNIRNDWGTYLYGNIGDGPYVGHTDASKRYQGGSKSQPEINGELYIQNNPL